jgi:iron(III) transport system permease protein
MTTTPAPTRPPATAPESGAPTGTPRRRATAPLRTRLLGLPLLVLIAFLVLVPVGFILLAAFSSDVPRPGSTGLEFTFDNLRVLAADGVTAAVMNSLVIAIGATALALVIGGALAFVTARTNVRARGFLYLIGLMPLFLPSYVGALAWSILASPGAGLINVGFRDLGITGPVVDVYSYAGVIVVMAMYYAPYAFLMIHSSMALMNPDLEDAAGVHGSPTWRALRSVTLPLSLPAILGSGLLIFVLVFENFPVSQVLATPGGIDTLPTFIYKLMNTTPSRGNEAAVVAILLVAVVVLMTWLQRRFLASRSFTTVSGKGVKARTIALGRWRTPVLLAALTYFLLSIVLPLLALLLSAVRSSPYMRSFTSLADPGAIDITSFAAAVTSDGFLGATTNSVVVSVAAAAIGTAVAFAVAYVVYRTRSWGKGALEGVSMVPLAIPHVVLGIGLLWTWLVLPVPVYGTLWVLIIGFLVVQMPQGFRGIASSIRSLDRDLEDSAVMLGARRTRAVAWITLPLLRVSVLSTFLLLLMLSMRELTVPLFLYTTDTEILSIAIYDQFENGGALREASATALVYCAIMFLLSYLPRRFGAGSGGRHA